MRVPAAADCPKAHQTLGGKAQQRLTRELGLTDQPDLGQTSNRIELAKGLPDALAHLLTGFVARVPRDSGIHR